MCHRGVNNGFGLILEEGLQNHVEGGQRAVAVVSNYVVGDAWSGWFNRLHHKVLLDNIWGFEFIHEA